MSPRRAALPLALVALLLPAVGHADGRRAETGVHGGKVVDADQVRLEVVLTDELIRVWVEAKDEARTPVPLGGVQGRIQMAVVRRNAPGRGNHQGASVTLHPVAKSAKEGRSRDLLQGKHALGEQTRQLTRLDITLTNLPGGVTARAEVDLTGTSPEVLYVCETDREVKCLDPGECRQCKAPLVKQVDGEVERPEAEGKKPRRAR
jgi:hypothetical protein